MSEDKVTPNAVIYFDGGSHTEKGLASYGLHAYTYIEEIPKQGSGCQKAYLTKDGYKPKEETNETAFPVVTILNYYDQYGNVLSSGTNNVGEILGAIAAFKFLLEIKPKEATIYGDSKYVLDGLEKWSDNWVKNNWVKSDGTEVKNRDLWEQLIALKEEVIAAGIQYQLKWVKGHSGDVGNEKADELSTIGLIYSLKGVAVDKVKQSEAKGYWNKSFEYNRMIDKPSWCFNSFHPNVVADRQLIKPSGHFVYHLSNHGSDDDDLGKPIADSSMSILYLEKPIEEMTLIQNFQNSLNTDSYESLVVAKLSRILSAKVANTLKEFKDDILLRAERVKNVLLCKTLLTEEKTPAQLGFHAVKSFNILETLLDQYLEDPEKYKISVTDLTHLFYSVDNSGKKEIVKLVPSLTTSTKKVNVLAKYDTLANSGEIEVPLLIGIDTPTRNALAALAEFKPTLHLLTWRESDISFRYATVLKVGNDVGIWAGVYSNLRLITSKK